MIGDQQLRIAEEIIRSYDHSLPLAKHLANHFRKNKQMGSRDRRTASQLCYGYYRLGNALPELTIKEQILIGNFLIEKNPDAFFTQFHADWKEQVADSLKDKISFIRTLYPAFNINDVFPFQEHLSGGINKEEFLHSFFIQPDLFIRIRKGMEEEVKKRLTKENISFAEINDQCLSFANGTSLACLDEPYKGLKIYEVQDRSSQYTGTYFQPHRWEQWWDCCAASGGKSLLLMEQAPDIKLLVSDIRSSLLENLKERFREAGILKYQSKEIDLCGVLGPFLSGYEFDGIILDAPCSGSGTWGRSPEMISGFEEGKIRSFQKLQRQIISNVIPFLKPGQPLIYITCSAFKEENEEQVKFMEEELGMKLEKMELIKGYEHRADTMFVSRVVISH